MACSGEDVFHANRNRLLCPQPVAVAAAGTDMQAAILQSPSARHPEPSRCICVSPIPYDNGRRSLIGTTQRYACAMVATGMRGLKWFLAACFGNVGQQFMVQKSRGLRYSRQAGRSYGLEVMELGRAHCMVESDEQTTAKAKRQARRTNTWIGTHCEEQLMYVGGTVVVRVVLNRRALTHVQSSSCWSLSVY
jgi:hypothetical protein